MSMSNDELQQLLLATFADQAKEQLQKINELLLALEKSDDGEKGPLLEEIFREAHSLKGASRAVDLARVEAVAHKLESLFSVIQKGEREAGPEIFDLAYQALDALTALVEEGLSGTAADVDVDGMCAALMGAAEGTKPGERNPQSPIPDPRSPAKPAQPAAPAETVRVATSKLDALMAQVGELLAARLSAEHRKIQIRSLFELLLELDGDERLCELREGLDKLRRDFEADSRRMAQITADLQDDVRRTRMLPVSTVFDTFPRMVRDLSRELSKEVALTIEGGETEVDKQVLEQLRSPLTHMVRNCVDHGMEEPSAREAARKPREGKVTLTAYQRAADLVIEVADDGAGIDVQRVKAKAVENGLVSADQAASMTEREALWLIFRSGFSTKQAVTDLSGRGVGMDVVREHIERLQGIIDVDSTLGGGSKFTLCVPLSVATTHCLMVRCGTQTFGVPITSVERIVRLSADDVGRTLGQEAVCIDGHPLPLFRLAEVLGIPSEAAEDANRTAVILGSAERRVAFLVDGLLRAQEVATKTLPKPFVRVRHIAAATIVGTGEVVPILNVVDLLKAQPAVKVAGRRSQAAEPAAPAPAPAARQTILVVDDSVTIRAFEKALLESAGYDVSAASDGLEAWNLIQGDAPDLIVSDVEMPNMNGFELTERVRGDHKLRDMPLVLVTTLSSDEDRKRGLDAGADAYVIKGSAEQDQLLDTVRRLI